MNRKLITGATGNVGGLVVDRLLARGDRPRVFARNADKARARWGDRVELAVGTFEDATSLRTALDGIDTLLLVTSDEKIAELDALAADVAKSAGTKRLVKLSSLDASCGVGTGAWHAEGEAAIRASGVPFTFVRPSGFMSNALYWARTIVREGVTRSCTGDGAIPFVHPDDIAAVTVAALDGEHAGEVLPLTGPEAMTYAQMTAAIGKAIGRALRWEPVSEDAVRAEQRTWDVSPVSIEAHISIYRGIRDGLLSAVTPTVERVLGRPAHTFAQWVTEHVDAFR